MAYKRPPFTGIHETLPRQGEGAPNEGGGDIPPYGEDIINRIVDINFPGGGIGAIFVSGDTCCFLRAGYAPTLSFEQTWIGLGPFMFGNGGTNTGSSYANINGKPTFLMVGHGSSHYTSFKFGGIIALSHDGLHWEMPFFSTLDWHIGAVVWAADEGKFYAEGVIGGAWMSRTGRDWVHLPNEDFWRHCPPDEWPDGTRGYDPDTGDVLYPEDVPTNIIPGKFFRTYCTGFCGGMWIAAGRITSPYYTSATACSLDGARTWQVVTEGGLGMAADYDVRCISGGAVQDFGDTGFPHETQLLKSEP